MKFDGGAYALLILASLVDKAGKAYVIVIERAEAETNEMALKGSGEPDQAWLGIEDRSTKPRGQGLSCAGPALARGMVHGAIRKEETRMAIAGRRKLRECERVRDQSPL